ncbi:MAG: M55 family metallopeptidase [Candidatus Sumerlaeaceae bacterium]|nr:M55 family metallopeptidase [Candidatus Sumerlaeaceae bacterium]
MARRSKTRKNGAGSCPIERVLIWTDMEGISCITRWEQVNSTGSAYAEGRALYTEDVNAAVRGAKLAGFEEIYVVDGHGAGGAYSFNSYLKDKLEPGAQYVFGHRWGCFVEPLRVGRCAVVLVGAHARAGVADGVLCHTMSSESWYHATLNGKPIGEVGFAAAIAGSFGAPVVFVSGDAATCREARELLGEHLVCAQVKRGVTRFAAVCLPPAESQQLIEDGVYAALIRSAELLPAPYDPRSPMTLRVELTSPDKVKDYMGRMGISVVGPREIESKGETFWELWDRFWHY